MKIKSKNMFSIAALFWAAIFFSCKNDLKEVVAIAELKNEPVEQAKDVTLLYSDSAQVKLKLSAPAVDRYAPNVGKTIFPIGIHVQFLNKNGDTDTDMKADHAIKYEKTALTEATGNVVVINEKGDRLDTEKLIWNEKTERIYTDEFVKVTTATQVIKGEGLEADQQFRWYEIKNIIGTISIDDEQN